MASSPVRRPHTDTDRLGQCVDWWSSFQSIDVTGNAEAAVGAFHRRQGVIAFSGRECRCRVIQATAPHDSFGALRRAGWIGQDAAFFVRRIRAGQVGAPFEDVAGHGENSEGAGASGFVAHRSGESGGPAQPIDRAAGVRFGIAPGKPAPIGPPGGELPLSLAWPTNPSVTSMPPRRIASSRAIAPSVVVDYRVMAVPRGHGQSDKPATGYSWGSDYAEDISAFITEQLDEPAIVLGHSLGAVVAPLWLFRQARQCAPSSWKTRQPSLPWITCAPGSYPYSQ